MKMRKLLVAVLVCFAGVLLLGFFFRNALVNWAFNRVSEHVKKVYHARLSATDIRFLGYNQVSIKNLNLQPDNADTLFSVNYLEAHIKLTALLKGQLNFTGIKLSDLNISINNTGNRNNFRFLLKPDSNQISNEVGEIKRITYRETALRAEKRLLKALNTAFGINGFRLSYRDSSRQENIYSPAINYNLKNFSSLLINRQMPDTFQINGNVANKGRQLEFSIQHTGPSTTFIPFLDSEKGVKCSFQAINGTIQMDDNADEPFSSFNLTSKNVRINYWRLAKGDVIFESSQLKGAIRIGEHSIELDSSTNLLANKANFKLFANYSRDTTTSFSLAVHMPETISDTFFQALPAGAFTTLNGISCSGTLTYDLQFSINTALPDSLVFLSTLSRKNFHINHFGTENFARVNEPFTYYAYNGEQLVRAIEVGPANPMFTPLKRINPLLVSCVLQSEDPSFMTHHGFLAESFRESIAQDYKEKRFARGGSTISMQFVKNVFLSRDKTVTRKVQEALIVYLIENLGLISKERMLEIYLNVIEWGPDIYGIGEASKFYFNKTPQQLNFNECLFLAAIIPNPKYFRYQFDKDGHIKSYMADYFKLLSTRMALRNLISNDELQKLTPDVRLSGPACLLVTPNDTMPAEDELPEAE
jgi:Transglycosylase